MNTQTGCPREKIDIQLTIVWNRFVEAYGRTEHRVGTLSLSHSVSHIFPVHIFFSSSEMKRGLILPFANNKEKKKKSNW